jgi:hypothetical protein
MLEIQKNPMSQASTWRATFKASKSMLYIDNFMRAGNIAREPEMGPGR